MPELDLSPSGSDIVDYSMSETPNTEVVGGQTSCQWRAGAEVPPLVVREGTHAWTTGERAPARPDVETLGWLTPPRHQVGLGAVRWLLDRWDDTSPKERLEEAQAGRCLEVSTFVRLPAFGWHICFLLI